MSELFRFLMMRPSAPADPVLVSPSAQFQNRITEARNHAEGRAAVRIAAEAIIADRPVKSLDNLKYSPKLVALDRGLTVLAYGDPSAVTESVVTKLVKSILGDNSGPIVAAQEFIDEREALGDLLIAAKLLSRDGEVSAVRFESVLRMMAFLVAHAADGGAFETAGALQAALARATQIGAVLPPTPRPDPAKEPPVDESNIERLKHLHQRVSDLDSVATTLTRLEPTDFERPEGPDQGRSVVPEIEVRALIARKLVESARDGVLRPFEAGGVASLVDDVSRSASVNDIEGTTETTPPRLMATKSVVERFGDGGRETLRSLAIDLSSMPTPVALEVLRGELTKNLVEIASLEESTSHVQLIGSSVRDTSHMHTLGSSLGSLPSSHGTVQPVGVGDLLVVRQHIKRYEGGEIGHIENVLDGEHRKRALRRSQTTETTTTVEVETTKDEERDSQSTERFELQREASSVMKEDQSLKAGLSVSGSYGPTVEFKASADFAMNQSKEESAKTASKYSKDVTERAVTKVSERRRTEQVLRTLEVFEETNEHGIDNPAGNGHVIGPYEWVDKVYEAQVYNYGKRMMFDFMVPEPSAFWLYATTSRPQPGTTLSKPIDFTLSPDSLSEYNYGIYVQRYQVPGVQSPPVPYTSVSKTLDGSATDDEFGSFTKVADLPIPDGYQSVTATVTGLLTFWHPDWAIDYAIGTNTWREQAGTSFGHSFTLGNETGVIPFVFKTFHCAKVAVAVEVQCQRTQRAMANWRLETHAAITQAWLKLKRDYEDALAALEVQAANAVQGRDPAENRQIERAELRKFAISTLTAQQFDLFGAIVPAPQGFPELDIAEADAEGRYIRFFEQAFEWEQMMYLFYPYYWGRKANWLTQSQLQDVDPQFADFLKAGAARVVLPVRPGFETAVAHFLDTGEIWEGADPPLLTSPLYVSIIQEIKERDLAPGTEIAQGDSWDVHLPTTLVRLRADGSLPQWHKNANGEWVPV